VTATFPVLADAGTMIGRISGGLLGAVFVIWGVWRLSHLIRSSRRPRHRP